MERKAQAQVITTILIILLVLAVIVIVWQVVTRTVTESTGTLTERTECIGLNMVVNSASGTSVVVQRNAGGPSGDVTPIILVGGEIVTGTTCADVGQLETVTCTVAALTLGQKVTVGGKIDEVACDFVSAEFSAT